MKEIRRWNRGALREALKYMRMAVIRLAAVAVGIVAVLSCDAGPVQPRFGNGISGGLTGTNPVTPSNPGGPDTSKPFTRIDTPVVVGQLVNVGDSILVAVRAIDDRQVQSVDILGMKFSGSALFGTATQTVRYPTVTAPSGTPFRVGLTDTTILRYLKPALPLDSTLDSLIILAITHDGAGNVDTARKRVQLVVGPSVHIITPAPNDS